MTQGDGEEQAIGARADTPDVFISYASQDSAVANAVADAVADAVAAALEGQGVKCWIAPRTQSALI